MIGAIEEETRMVGVLPGCSQLCRAAEFCRHDADGGSRSCGAKELAAGDASPFHGNEEV